MVEWVRTDDYIYVVGDALLFAPDTIEHIELGDGHFTVILSKGEVQVFSPIKEVRYNPKPSW